ncbi:MAG: hypothetical protein OEY56_14805, partial [Cyclobacteriaceae bacterium]|nr:hypothetical protein [Cyclobacteriaceae bacterium]
MALAYKGGFIYPDHRLAGLTTYTDSWEIHYRLEAEQTSWLDLFSVPDVGLALKITDFNHPQVGIGINPMGYFNFRLLGKHALSVNGTLGTGLSFFTESYSAT